MSDKLIVHSVTPVFKHPQEVIKKMHDDIVAKDKRIKELERLLKNVRGHLRPTIWGEDKILLYCIDEALKEV